jgi:energy-coupling factor transporter ATP-binding protein EcfA2
MSNLSLNLQEIEQCLKIANNLQSLYSFQKNEKDRIYSEVQKAQKWLVKKPEYLKFLNHLQEILHQNNVGTFSELLTYFVKDILKKDKSIILDLYTYHNLPALRIEASNQGQKESIYDGSGGSIANIVSTGLRLIALSRMNNRQFIILDEPDCWLKPEHVPFFAKIIGEISEKLKIQTIIISHHNWQYFKDYGRVIHLFHNGKNLETEIIHDANIPFDENIDYIKKVRLKNFMSHYDSVFDLHPYLNCLVGENDIGKSVLSTAFKSVSYNESSDSYIQHYEKEAQVYIELSTNKQILWQRFLTTTQENPQKVLYSLYDNHQLTNSEYNSNDVPDFIEKVLNIRTIEDIDVHVGHQKQPVFLISSDVKPNVRAKILSLGREALLIQKMMENIKSKTKINQKIVSDGEKKYHSILNQLGLLENIDEIVQQIEMLKKEFIELENEAQYLQELEELIQNLQYHYAIQMIPIVDYIIPSVQLEDTEHLNQTIYDLMLNYKISIISMIDYNIDFPILENTLDLQKMINRLFWTAKGANIDIIQIPNFDFSIESSQELENLIKELSYYQSLSEIQNINFSIPSIDIEDVDELSSLIETLSHQQSQLIDLELQKSKNYQSYQIIEKEINQFLEKIGYICPTCHQSIDSKHLLGENHEQK